MARLATALFFGLTTSLPLATPCTLAAQAAPPPSPFVGIWEGHLDAGAARLRLVFHVTAGEDGALGGALDSPDQGANGIPASSVTVEGDTLVFAITALGARYRATLSADQARLEGTFTQGAARLPLALARVEAPTAPDRPQNPSEPYPYRSQEVQLPGGAEGVTLHGTLTLPEGDGPFPAAVLVSGSGPQDRDETLLGHKPFLVLADHLTRSGIAVLRYDDRGVGASTGTFATATSEDFAADALAAVAFLKLRADIGPVGIVGHSEGGLVGPMAAARSADVAYVVMLAGPGLPGADIIRLQSELIARAQGASAEAVEANLRTQSRLFDIILAEPDPEVAEPRLVAALEASMAELPAELRQEMDEESSRAAMEQQVRSVNTPWFRYFLRYDPRPTLERVTVPVLVLNGALDLQVPAEVNTREVESALKRGGNGDVTVDVLPRLNHLFQTATTGSPTEYAGISETMSPSALERVSAWINERFAPPR